MAMSREMRNERRRIRRLIVRARRSLDRAAELAPGDPIDRKELAGKVAELKEAIQESESLLQT